MGPAFQSLLADAGRQPTADWIDRVSETVGPINIAGLCDPKKRHWYGVEAADLMAGAALLESSPEAIQAMLRKCGL
jgi:hypothetical protein